MKALLVVFLLAQAAPTAEEVQTAREWRDWRVGVSGFLCGLQAGRQEKVARIEEERRYAKLGGVINMSKVYDFQEHVRGFDKEIRKTRGDLKEGGATPIPCTNKLVGRVAKCLVIEWRRGYLDDPFTWVQTPRIWVDWSQGEGCDSDDLQAAKDALRA